MVENQVAWHRLHLQLLIQAKACVARAKKDAAQAATLRKAQYRERLQHKAGGMRDTYVALRAPFAPPVAFLEGPKGGLASHPEDLSQAMSDKWAPIFQGNKTIHETAAKFIQQYGQYIPSAPPWKISPSLSNNSLKPSKGLGALLLGLTAGSPVSWPSPPSLP